MNAFWRQFHQNQNFDKTSFIIYADLECLIEKIDRCKNNPENSFKTKVGEYIPSGFSIPKKSWVKNLENKHDIYRGKGCVKSACQSIREHAMKICTFKKKIMKFLTKEQQESYENAEMCYIFVNKNLKINMWKIKNIVKLEIIVI